MKLFLNELINNKLYVSGQFGECYNRVGDLGVGIENYVCHRRASPLCKTDFAVDGAFGYLRFAVAEPETVVGCVVVACNGEVCKIGVLLYGCRSRDVENVVVHG